jgi:hypothetical protein
MHLRALTDLTNDDKMDKIVAAYAAAVMAIGKENQCENMCSQIPIRAARAVPVDPAIAHTRVTLYVYSLRAQTRERPAARDDIFESVP